MTKSEKSKRTRLWELYRVTPEEIKAIEEYQLNTEFFVLLGVCMGVDHDHASGKIRGLIDFRINKALGLIEGVNKELAPRILRAMAVYLEKPPAEQVIGKRYGLIGEAKRKNLMVYGSEQGPLKPIRLKIRRRKKRK
jgi:hypothetical protein